MTFCARIVVTIMPKNESKISVSRQPVIAIIQKKEVLPLSNPFSLEMKEKNGKFGKKQ